MPTLSITNDKIFHLRDGRALSYTQYGDPVGKPVFFFHGLPGSRRQRHPDDSIATGLGVRLITIDRPGFGLSDFLRNRTLLDWPDDVAQLADALKIDRFAAIGLSGGGPYLLACARKLPERLTTATVVSGMGPLDEADALDGMLRSMRLGIGLARRAPAWLVRLAFEPTARLVRLNPSAAKKLVPISAPKADREMFARSDIREVDRQDLIEAYRRGGRAIYGEVMTLINPWGFRLQDIRKKIYLWHGQEDTTVPFNLARYVAHSLPSCEPRFYPGEGHTLLYNYWREILTVAIS